MKRRGEVKSEATQKELEQARRSDGAGNLLAVIGGIARERGCDITTNDVSWRDAAEAAVNAYVDEVLHIYKLTGQKPPFRKMEIQ